MIDTKVWKLESELADSKRTVDGLVALIVFVLAICLIVSNPKLIVRN